MHSRAELIFELLDEIKRLEDTVLYFNNKILRTRIAIAEIMNGAEVQHDRDELNVKRRRNGSLARGTWNKFLDDRNGDDFGRDDVIEFERKIGFEGNLVRRADHKIHHWLSTGAIRRSGHMRYVKNEAKIRF